MQLRIRKFDPSKMGHNRVVLICGKRNTGKSVLIKDLMYHLRDIPAGFVISGTAESTGWYRGWIPDCFVHEDFDKALIEKMIARQRRNLRAGRAQDCFLVLDDCMFDKKLLREKCMRSLFLNGRHYRCTLLLSSQYLMDVDVSCRSNTDYVFVLRETILANRERLYKNFFGMFPSFDAFCQVMDKCTENFECLVLDNTSRSNNLEDCVFWYKAKMRDNFRVGSEHFWRFHNERYNPSYGELPGAAAAAPEPKPNPKKPRVVVHKI